MSELWAADKAIVDVAPEDLAYVRFLTTYAVEKERRKDLVDAFVFVSNSTSTNRRIAFPTKITDTLWRIDLRDYNYTHAAWEFIAKRDPYFKYTVHRLSDLTTSANPVLRMDYFVAEALVEPSYSKLLGLPGDLASLKKKFFIQEDAIATFHLQQQGATLDSIVALHNRQLVRYPTIFGYFWFTRDAFTNANQNNVTEPENIFAIRFDGFEALWTLPNGLQAGWLGNAQEKQVEKVPSDIAQDSVTKFRDKQVYNYRSCARCHYRGINHFNDIISQMLQHDDIVLVEANRDKRVAIEDLYLSGIEEKIDEDRRTYAKALASCYPDRKADSDDQLEKLCLDIAVLVEQVIYQYREGWIDSSVAARELGIPEKDLPDQVYKKAISGELTGVLSVLASGGRVRRDAWESAWPKANQLLYRKIK
ncbi:MAG: hypothetical protein QXG97_00090 [Nitrososphaerota archaeon]